MYLGMMRSIVSKLATPRCGPHYLRRGTPPDLDNIEYLLRFESGAGPGPSAAEERRPLERCQRSRDPSSGDREQCLGVAAVGASVPEAHDALRVGDGDQLPVGAESSAAEGVGED